MPKFPAQRKVERPSLGLGSFLSVSLLRPLLFPIWHHV